MGKSTQSPSMQLLISTSFLLLGADLVTEYDRAVENMISTSLKEKYPDYEYASSLNPIPANQNIL